MTDDEIFVGATTNHNIEEGNSKLINLNFSFTGLLSWSAINCHVNLEEELNTITLQALEGEEGKNGKRNDVANLI